LIHYISNYIHYKFGNPDKANFLIGVDKIKTGKDDENTNSIDETILVIYKTNL